MGKFIVIDGQHGAGKSYIIDRLYDELTLKRYSVVRTKEPTDSEIGVLARNAENYYAEKTLTCLFAADRQQHCQQIQKWLYNDKIVISDRYIISGLILQNMDNVDFDYIRAVNCGIIIPDLSVVISASPSVIRERLKNKVSTRLAKQEQAEGYDRYLKYRDVIEGMFENVSFHINNTLTDGENIVKYIMEQL